MGIFKWYRQCLFSGAYIPLHRLKKMKAEGVRVEQVVSSYIHALKCGINISIEQLMQHDLAGGDVRQVVKGLIIASRLPENWNFEEMARAELEGKNIVKDLQTKANHPEKIRAYFEGEGKVSDKDPFHTLENHLTWGDKLGMTLRNSDKSTLIQCWKQAKKAGVNIPITILEAHSLGGGNVSSVVEAFLKSVEANKPVDLMKLFTLDLMGVDVLQVTQDFLQGKLVSEAIKK